MTTLVKNLIDKLNQKPEEEQNQYAAMFLGELEIEEKRDTLFADPRSHTLLSRMAAEAHEEHERGETEPLEDLLKRGE